MPVSTEKLVRTKPSTAARWLIGVAVVILAAFCIGGIVLASHWPFSAQNITKAMQEFWPGNVSMQKFHSTYFPFPGCVLEGVVLTRGSGAVSPPLVTIQKVTLEANYHDLFLRPGYIYKIILEGLKISVRSEPESWGSQKASNPGQSSVRLGEVFTKDATLEVARKNNSPLEFQIHQLSLKSITHSSPMSYDLTMRNPEPPGEIRSSGKLGPWDSKHLDNMPLSGRYTFDDVDLGVFNGIAGRLAAKGEFHGVLGRIETQGTADTPKFEVTRSRHTVPLKIKFVATVDGTGGDTILRSVDGMLLKTPIHAEGSVAAQPGQAGKTTSVNVTVNGGRIEDVLWLFVKANKSPLEGSTNFHTHIVWPAGRQTFLRCLTLRGEFDIEGVRWEKLEQQMSVNSLSKKASGNKDDVNTSDVTAVIKGSVLLSEAMAKFQDTSFEVPGAKATMHGTYSLEDAKIDFHGDLKTQANLSQDTSGVKAILLKPLDPLFKKKHAGAVVPIEMTGTYANPHFGISLPDK